MTSFGEGGSSPETTTSPSRSVPGRSGKKLPLCPLPRQAASGLAATGLAIALLVSSCQADLGARTSPVTEGAAMAGQAILFGRYEGLLRVGGDGAEYGMTLVADECGALLSGSVTGPSGETATITGERKGSSLILDFDSPDFSGQIDGHVVNVRVLGGTWASDQGQGGAWTALFAEGSQDEHPCPAAETLLEQTPR